MTRIHDNHELCQFRRVQPPLTIQGEMNEDLPELFGLAPEKALNYLFDRLPVGTAVIDRHFRLRRCNPTWAEFIERYTPSAASDVVPGVSLFDLEPGTEDVIKPLFAQVFAGEIVRQEGIRLESGGIVSYWDVVLVPLEVNGQVVAALDVSLNTTAHVLGRQSLQNTLQALQESETNLRSMLENAHGYAIYRVAIDPDHPYLGQVILVSPSIREVIGIESPYEFSTWFDGIHPDDRARIVAANRRALAEGVPFDEEMRFYDRQRAAWRWVHTVSNPIFDENGRVTHFNGITIDTTEQKQAQETLTQINLMLEQGVRERTQEIDQRRAVAESLRDILRVLNSNRPLPEILNHIVTQASQLMGADICTLHHIDYQQGFVGIEASCGLPATLQDITGFPLLSSQADERILHREPVVICSETPPVLDAAVESGLDARVRRWRAVLVPAYPAYLAVPLVVASEVYGSLAFYFARPRSFSQEAIDLALSLSEQAALAIDNARLRVQVGEAAVTSERNQLARELHDAVTQTLFSASLIADVLPRIWERSPEMGQAKLAELRELTRGALAEMRTLLLELRPATLTESSLDELLHQLAAAVVGRCRLQVEVTIAGEAQRPLPPDTQVALYRIAQEALNNVVKHAGATRVTITLQFAPNCVALVVADNGRGFDPTATSVHSLGLGIMRERAAKINADLRIESIIGEGTHIRVQVCE